MNAPTRQPARDFAAEHFGIDASRVEPMTAHKTFGDAEIARVELVFRHVPLPETVEIRTCPAPAGERLPWMLVAILPEPAVAPLVSGAHIRQAA